MFVDATRAKVAALLSEGLSLAEIARRSGLAYTTVSYHRDRLHNPRAEPDADPRPASEPHDYLQPVTTREEVHRMLSAGHSRGGIARALGISKSTVTYHARRFGMEVDERAARRYDWNAIQAYYDEGHSVRECCAKFGFASASWTSAVRRGAVVARPMMMPIDQLLGLSRSRQNLKRRLLEAGLLPQRCQTCGIEDWQGRALSLQLHHVNGKREDNRLENLTLLCPNCHSQTRTWAGRNGRGDRGIGSGGASQRAA
jgi:DNA-binding CsgD family transcriptional regulator